MKSFNGREIELLAPAGTFEDFKCLLGSGADAFYMGGKRFNMRMHRKGHNLSNEELETAVHMAHEKGKKIYITFNNMMSSNEMEESREYLKFLESINPDALIIQDPGAVKLIRDERFDLNMHLSVMANVHSLSMVKLARSLGVTRIVTSRELSLDDVRNFVREVPEMEYEYFIHGDMCSAHGSQCLYSGILFGKSSNRGLCMKPCRWAFKGRDENETVYPLAVKDMCLYRHIPELLVSGVNSFKIEGRMRGSEHLTSIVNHYRNAIDRYLEDPTGYSNDEDISSSFFETRVRNISTAYAFKKPGASNIDITGEREPRIFSRPVEESDIDEHRIAKARELLELDKDSKYKNPHLAVKVNNMEAFKKACDNGADLIYLAGEVFKPDKPFKKQDIKEAVHYAGDKRVYYSLPRMANERQMIELSWLIPEIKKIGAAGVIIGSMGELYEFNDVSEGKSPLQAEDTSVGKGGTAKTNCKLQWGCNYPSEVVKHKQKLRSNFCDFNNSDLEFRGDFSLNVYNEITSSFYEEHGLSSVTLSVEASATVLKTALARSKTPMEVIVQGTPGVMYLEHCLISAQHGETSCDFCRDYCRDGQFSMEDENGTVHRVFSDQHCRNHMVLTKDICYLPFLGELKGLGASTFRIEGQHYTPEQVGKVVKMYRSILDNIESYEWNAGYLSQLEEITGRKQSLQSLNF